MRSFALKAPILSLICFTILHSIVIAEERSSHHMMARFSDINHPGILGGWSTWTLVIWGSLLVIVTVIITRLLTTPGKKRFNVSFVVGGPMKKKQYLISFLLLAVTLALHLFISKEILALHIIFRFLYLVPIAYVGLKAGKKGGLSTAVVATILYLPHFLFGTSSTEFQTGNIVAVILFYVTGFFSGQYRDFSKRDYLTQMGGTIKKPVSSATKNVLFYIDENPLSQYASEWFGQFFGSPQDVNVTLLWISVENVEDILETAEEVDNYISKLRQVSREKIELVEKAFLDVGFFDESIQTKIIRLKDKVRLASVILEELNSASYDFVIVPKYKLNRSQEFLFGDTAIQLIRESGYPVLTITGNSDH